MTQPIPIRPQKQTAPVSKFDLSKILTKAQRAPYRLILWGVAGVGKTTFAAHAPNPIVLCAEQGAEEMDVARTPLLETWEQLGDVLAVLREPEHEYKTLVVDSTTSLERLLHEYLCRTNGWRSMDELAFGKCHDAAIKEWRALIQSMDFLRRSRQMNIILIGHSSTKPFKNPEGEDFDRYELCLNKKAAEELTNWCDAILFARYELFTAENKKRIRGVSTGARIIHTQWNAAFTAKNRYSLPETLPLVYEEFAKAMDGAYSPEHIAGLKKQIEEMRSQLVGTEHEGNISKGLSWAGEDPSKLRQVLDKLRGQAGLDGNADNNAVKGDQ